MGTEAIITNWWNIVGGLSGAALLTYFILMVYYTRRRDEREQRLEVRLARIEGLLLGRRSR